ncbi:hypothetical protein OG423_14240 [Micromonospora zamorensis]|uniref:hypothetical protein n=1 Tax=Micromonospora zamorensis TaxID=709883 RepID=UPI00352A9964|nr:hypothetical protein OG423_14240 [Micromonospora zamorensis]
MSWEAIRWVLEDAPDLPSHLVSPLVALADSAAPDGTGAFLGQPEIAWRTRKALRNSRKDIDSLEKLGLIREGDQSLAQYIRSDRRPTVYDLAMERKRGPRPSDEGMQASPRTGSHGGMPASPREPSDGMSASPRSDARGDAGDLSRNGQSGREGMHTSSREGHGGMQASPELKKRRTSSSSPPPVARIADALDISDSDAKAIWDRFVADPSVRAPSRFVDSLIASGDIAKHRPAPKATASTAGHPYEDSGRGYCARCMQPEKHARHGGTK